MREVTTYGSITEGRLKVYRRADFLRALSLLSGRVVVTVTRAYRKRSTPQNAYYWGVIVSIARECISEAWHEKIEPQQAHEILKQQCNSKPLVSADGLTVDAPCSTATLTTVEAEEYYERCRIWLAEFFGVDVPLPNEQTELKL